MADVFLLLASLTVVMVGAALIVFQRRASLARRRRELDRHEKWLLSDEYISRVNAASSEEDLRRAQEGK